MTAEALPAWGQTPAMLRDALDRAIEESGPTPCMTTDPDLWFRQESRSDTRYAVQACITECPVRELCAAYALAADERWGVWGGLNSPNGRELPENPGRLGTPPVT